MSTAVYPDAELNQEFTDTWKVNNRVLRLFSNNLTITSGTVLANLTEVVGNGYAAITLTAASFTLTNLGPGCKCVYALQTFSFTGPAGPIYGYYYTNAGNTALYGPIVKFDSPFNILTSANQIKITPDVRKFGGF